MNRILIVLIIAAFIAAALRAGGEERGGNEMEWTAEVIANAGSGDFAPHYISALRHGRLTQTNGLTASYGVRREMRNDKRFSWGGGAELLGVVTSGNDYRHWNYDGTEGSSRVRPGIVRIQQLYGEVKWRSLFLEAGMKERGSALLNDTLTSGDVVESGNARSIPQVRAGFIDFETVPLTGGWLQVQGELGYGKQTDGGWMKKFYSYGSYHLNSGAYYLYRRLYFRSNPEKRLTVTLGMQAAGQIGGVTKYYERGVAVRERNLKAGLWKMIKMIAPVGGASDGVGEYMDGNNLGSWDVHLRYRLTRRGDEIKVYLQKPWEKGSSIGWQNGVDGLWGVEYKWGNREGIVTGAVVEYIDFMNQSGALHYAPHDRPGSTITTNSIGGDQYYNNSEYNSYMNYGQGVGTPFLVAPLYNLDGYPAYVDNRVRGFHAALRGMVAKGWWYKVAASHKKGYGDGRQPKAKVSSGTSWLAEVSYECKRVTGLSLKFQVAMDRGMMPGDNFGMAVSAVYRGSFLRRGGR